MDDKRFVPRPAYDDLLVQAQNMASIKVISGVRRCGKSTLLSMHADRLRTEGIPENNILYRKMDSFDVPLEPDALWLESLLKEAIEKRDASRPLYVFLDEIQEVKGWEKVVRRLHSERIADIYLTGSNAFLLSSDLATYLSGRYIELHVWPLSFSEYLSFARIMETDLDRDKLFARYVRYGGMPGLFEFGDFSEAMVTRELSAIHDAVILNDVAKRFELRDIDLLEKLVKYVYTTSGNLFSVRKIAGALTSAGRKTSVQTVDAYLGALERAYLVNPCTQYGVGGKEILQPQNKWYAPDSGLRNREMGFAVRDMGFQLEGVVYCELRRRGYKVNVGTGLVGEIDFVATRGSEKLYVQISNSIVDERTLERELAPLEAVPDSFPKLLLTRDALAWGTTDSGIRICDLVDWLQEE